MLKKTLPIIKSIFSSIKSFFPLFLFFLNDLYLYLDKKVRIFCNNFETGKGFLVNLLMAKRGRYQLPFLNLSLFVLVASGIMVAPHLSAYYPDVVKGDVLAATSPNSPTDLTSIENEEMSLVTTKSVRLRDRVEDYTIVAGDTVSSVAEKFGVSEDTIKWVNNLKGKNPILNTGDVLKIPPVTGIVHKVKSGETVYSIAEKYQANAQNIVNFPFNDFADLDNFTLSIGQTLIVPDGVMPEEKPVVRPMAPQYIAGGSGQFLFPTNGVITQQPIWYHMALDIANASGPDIFAANDGVVIYSACLTWGYGCHVIVDHGGGLKTLYGHMQKFYVSAGEKVSRGSALGRMGSTGRSTGTHLHFEVRVNDVTVNPWSYVK